MDADFTWDTEQLLTLRVGALVLQWDRGVANTVKVLQEPVYDPDWEAGWRIFLEHEGSCFTSCVGKLDPSTVVPPESEAGQDMIRLAHNLRAERDVLRGQVRRTRFEVLTEVLADLHDPDFDLAEAQEKFEEMLEEA